MKSAEEANNKDQRENKEFPSVQWLGLVTFIALAWVQSLVRELRSHKSQHGQNKLVNKIKINLKKKGFPVDPVVRTPCFHCRGPGFDPRLGN